MSAPQLRQASQREMHHDSMMSPRQEDRRANQKARTRAAIVDAVRLAPGARPYADRRGRAREALDLLTCGLSTPPHLRTGP